MANPKSLYDITKTHGIKIYDMNNNYIGKTTSIKSIARNGKCIGSIEIENPNEEFEWISGYGVFIVGMGIKVIEYKA